MIIMDPGKNLKAMREAMHWTQRELGKRAGISKGQISHLETGNKRAGPKTRHRLAEAFNME
jgi:transcriptional regulator with XRE-family HTH domain